MKNFRTVTIFLVLLALPVIASAQKGKPSASPTPTPRVVSATFVHCSGDPTCESDNRVRQDRNEPYVNGVDGVSISNNATATSGEIIVSLNNSNTRSVVYDFTSVVNPGNPVPSVANTVQNFKVHFFLHDAYSMRVTGACAGGASPCEAERVTPIGGLNGGFYIGKVRHILQWNPTSQFAWVNKPQESSAIKINYKRDTDGSETWTVVPEYNRVKNDDGTYSYGTYKLSGMQIEEGRTVSSGGQYHMPFTLVITSK